MVDPIQLTMLLVALGSGIVIGYAIAMLINML